MTYKQKKKTSQRPLPSGLSSSVWRRKKREEKNLPPREKFSGFPSPNRYFYTLETGGLVEWLKDFSVSIILTTYMNKATAVCHLFIFLFCFCAQKVADAARFTFFTGEKSFAQRETFKWNNIYRCRRNNQRERRAKKKKKKTPFYYRHRYYLYDGRGGLHSFKYSLSPTSKNILRRRAPCRGYGRVPPPPPPPPPRPVAAFVNARVACKEPCKRIRSHYIYAVFSKRLPPPALFTT